MEPGKSSITGTLCTPTNLYTYEEDTGAGMVKGQGVQTYGGTWWVVPADGKAVTTYH